MSILGKLMGTAQSATRGAARGGRGAARPGRGMGRATSARRGTGRGRAAPTTGGGIGRLVQGFLRRR
ncbi:hypothetical protein QOZ88_15585 [Blastococcus sp. BMG 814]|uniref:Uncharacterized protein n=1 Tax=Blastococcus carthaginiensis TaxID=3050034 RepID=A0ABT9IFZ4_9ACTN|nr:MULTISPECIES: hypothetical protein [Blastococcus]MDP5184059.1 hypothetical protein [Blastococcus carthaginiensis]